jgi:branched-chain amino acid aminotransferase
MGLFNYNGATGTGAEPLLPLQSRVYRYGDGFFESMKFSDGHIRHLEKHFVRIRKSAMLLKMTLPSDLNAESFEQRVRDTAAKDGLANARVRCCFLRECAGLYTPETQDTSIIIEIIASDHAGYQMNEAGLKMGMFKELSKNGNYLSMLKTTSALIYVMAGIFCRENELDDCIIFNDHGLVAETMNSNLFMASGDFLVTPPISEYCIDGVMRGVIMQLAEAYGYTVREQPISEVSLMTADEIFTTSATRGVQFVATLGGKTFNSTRTRVLNELLNK